MNLIFAIGQEKPENKGGQATLAHPCFQDFFAK
jgi:hypothetical protein